LMLEGPIDARPPRGNPERCLAVYRSGHGSQSGAGCRGPAPAPRLGPVQASEGLNERPAAREQSSGAPLLDTPPAPSSLLQPDDSIAPLQMYWAVSHLKRSLNSWFSLWFCRARWIPSGTYSRIAQTNNAKPTLPTTTNPVVGCGLPLSSVGAATQAN